MMVKTATCYATGETGKRLFRGLVLCLVALILVGTAAISLGCGKSTPASYGIITPAELQANLSAGEKPVIIDLRELELYQAGHIPGAVNIPYAGFSQRINELKPNVKTVLVCHNGPMGDSSASLLAERGFTQVWNVKGGMAAWKGQLEK